MRTIGQEPPPILAGMTNSFSSVPKSEKFNGPVDKLPQECTCSVEPTSCVCGPDENGSFWADLPFLRSCLKTSYEHVIQEGNELVYIHAWEQTCLLRRISTCSFNSGTQNGIRAIFHNAKTRLVSAGQDWFMRTLLRNPLRDKKSSFWPFQEILKNCITALVEVC